MKTTTCRELKGPCDQNLSAETWDEMASTMNHHVIENHIDAHDMTDVYVEISLKNLWKITHIKN